MNGDLAALIALCLHGNEWLASGTGNPPALDAGNSTFQYVERVHATCPRRRLLGTRRWEADSVAEWLRFVEGTGARRLSLVVGGASGGRWALVDDAPAPRLWQSHWAVRDRNRPDRRIWAVELTGTPLGEALPPQPAPASARDDLRAALEAIERFADADAGLADWSAWFAEALRLLEAAEPVIPYHPDLAPDGLPLESRRLLAAAVKAWVFGGMGSWNDLAYPEGARRAEYEQQTGRLYRSVLAALLAVTRGPLPARA
jgi:hypothetical protein